MKSILPTRALLAALALALAGPAVQADMKSDWTELARVVIGKSGQPAAQSARNALLVQDAIGRAGQSANGGNGSGNGGAGHSTQRGEAAVAVAAFAILEHLYPEQLADLEVRLAVSLADLPETDAKAEGLIIGRRVAAQVVAAQ